MGLRSIRVVRGLGSKRNKSLGENVNVHVPTEQTTVYDEPHIYAAEDLVPQIVERSRNANKVDRIQVHYYQKKKWGRLCTCWDNTERIPRQDCHACFGSGRPGGFLKFGTETILIDASLPKLALVNIVINDVERPYRLELEETKSEGFVEGTFDILPNLGQLDTLAIFPKELPSAQYSVVVSKADGSDPRPITDRTWIELLAEKKIKVRIALRRGSAENSPYIESFFLRYNVLNPVVNSDWPRLLRSVSMEDLGLPDVPQTASVFLDDTVQMVSVEDYLYNMREGRAWKIVEANENRPLGIVTSWDLQCRRVQDFEIFNDFPR